MNSLNIKFISHKIVKMAVLKIELLQSLKLISRKISVIEKSWNFQIVPLLEELYLLCIWMLIRGGHNWPNIWQENNSRFCSRWFCTRFLTSIMNFQKSVPLRTRWQINASQSSTNSNSSSDKYWRILVGVWSVQGWGPRTSDSKSLILAPSPN